MDLISSSKKKGPIYDDRITSAMNKVSQAKILHEQSIWEYEWEKLRLERFKKKIDVKKRDWERAEEDQDELLIAQNEKKDRKKLKIEVQPRQRIQPKQNINENKVVTNFSAGKKSVEKMDTEEIFMQESKKPTQIFQQNVENTLRQLPLVYFDNNGKVCINPNEQGFIPQMEQLSNFMDYTQEQVNNLYEIPRGYFDKCLPWIMTARILQEQRDKEIKSNQSSNKKL